MPIYFLNRIFILFFSIFSLSLTSSCLPFSFDKNLFINSETGVYFLGQTDTRYFQLTCEEVLPFYGYQIDMYENSQLVSEVLTKWKIKDPFIAEKNMGFLESKVRIKIRGEILTESFSLRGGYKYNCFLEIENVGFKDNQYILIPHCEEFEKYTQMIVNHLKEKFVQYT